MSVFCLLVRAHDRIITDKRFELSARKAAAAILWQLAIAVPIGSRYQP